MNKLICIIIYLTAITIIGAQQYSKLYVIKLHFDSNDLIWNIYTQFTLLIFENTVNSENKF